MRQFSMRRPRRAGPLLAGVKRLRPPSNRRDRDNIAAHYDLSNDFFALMLDPTMAYSCAYFSRRGQSLERPRWPSSSRIATKLDLGPEDHVIEIGTGWGGLADPRRRHTAAA